MSVSTAVEAMEGAQHLLELVAVAGIALDHPARDPARGLHPCHHVGRHRRLVGINLTAIFGDTLDPGGVDVAAVIAGEALGALLTELGGDFLGDDVGDIVAQQGDVALERAVAVVSRQARPHLLVGQLLQLSSLATHPSALRNPLAVGEVLRREWLRRG